MNILDDQILLSEKDLLMTIWTKPKLTLEFIQKNCPGKYVNRLVVLGGMVGTVAQNARYFSIPGYGFLFILVVAVCLGGFLFWLFSYIYAALLSWTGVWLGGKTDTPEFFTIIAWSMVPSICFLFPAILKIIIFGDGSGFAFYESSNVMVILYYFFDGIKFILNAWTLVILIKGISQIQKFSIGRAVLNACLPLILFAILILMVIGIVFIFN